MPAPPAVDMTWLVTVALAATPTPSPSVARSVDGGGFELRVGDLWTPVALPLKVDRISAVPFQDGFLVVEMSYEGGNGMGCEAHELVYVAVAGGALQRRASPSLDLGIACWSRDAQPQGGPSSERNPRVEDPFLHPEVEGDEFVLVSGAAGRVRQPSSVTMGEMGGRPASTGRGPWTLAFSPVDAADRTEVPDPELPEERR
jgi:hypothetical protein